jgi:hypothetical protein
MNASEQAKGLTIATKIAAAVNLFKSEFPDARADLKPWKNDPETRQQLDPDSIDLGFHFPGWSRRLQSRSILIQIRFHNDPFDRVQRAIGIDIAGFGHNGQAWQLSTVEAWQFVGESQPVEEVKRKLKDFCKHIFAIFNSIENYNSNF